MSTTVIIIQQVSSTEVIVQCARCEGTGRVWPGEANGDPCWVCNGKGKLLLEIERMPLVECARCNGSGRIWPGQANSDECPSCGGAGCQPIVGNFKIINN